MSQPADPRPPQMLQGPVAEEIDIMAVLRLLYAKRLSLFLGGVAGAVLGLLLSFAVPDLYTSTVKVSPVSGGGMNSMLRQYGGLASLAGISLPQTNEGDKTALALATLDSDDFLANFIETNGFEVSLLAATAWQRESGEIVYDADYVDSEGNLIVTSGSEYALLREEFLQQLRDTLTIVEDQTTAFITMKFTHVSPVFASHLLRSLVADVNKTLRDMDVQEAEAAIKYLQEYVQEVQFTEVKEAMYGLLQSQIETIMLANVRPEYVFRIIDGPSEPVLRSSPNRLLYIVAGGVLGALAILLGSSLIRLREKLRDDL
jgi:LPS O-antigen subunit length determinant protein (WzzB/FepE family)